MTTIKRFITRREFLRVAGVTGVGLGLAACGPATPAPSAPATEQQEAPVAEKQEEAPAAVAKKVVVMSVIPGPAGTAVQGNAEAFNKERPDAEVKVNVAGGAETEYKPNFPQIAMSEDRPDLAWYWVDGRQYQDLVAAGALEPLDDLYKREGWDKVLPEAVLNKYTSPDGHRYAVVQDVVVYPQVYYNKEIFDEVGVKLPANGIAYESLEEWYEVCDKIRAAGYEPVTVGMKEGWRIGHVHDVLLQRMIPQDLFNDFYDNWRPGWEPKVHYNGPEWLAADKMLKEWFDKGVFAEGDLGRNYAEGRALFVQKKAAMYQDGSWAIGILRDEAPDLEFGWMLYPQVKPEIKPAFLIYAGGGLMMLKDPDNKEVAEDFLAFCLKPERAIWMLKEVGLVPARTDLPADAFDVMDPLLKDMWLHIAEVGTSTGWDDPVPADMAERSFILFQEMMTDARTPEAVGEEIEKLAERHRQKA